MKEPLRMRHPWKVLQGKVAVVTGASHGVGAVIAESLAAAGASVAVNYFDDEEEACSVVEAICWHGGKAMTVQGDVSVAEDVARIFDRVEQHWGNAEILINAAGKCPLEPVPDVTKDEFHRRFDLNVLSTILMSQEAARRFGDCGGSIINIGVAGEIPDMPASVLHAALKGAQDSITGVLAKQLRSKRIRVNSVNLDLTTVGILPGSMNSIQGTQSQWRLDVGPQLPSTLARIAVFLASDASVALSGETLLASNATR